MNINQEQLNIFKTVMETGSFSAAARQLGKVPSAISMSIANLEIDLNLKLFERIGREPKPTDQAHVLYKKTLLLLTEIQQWAQHAHALSTGLESTLSIVVVSELIHTEWTDYIALLEHEFPMLQIDIFSAPQEDALRILMQGDVQFALMFERESLDHRESFIELKQETLVPVVSLQHPLAQQQQISLETLRYYRQVIVTARDRHIKPELLFSSQYWRTDNHQLALSLILKNLGWGLLPLTMLQQNPLLYTQLKILDILDITPQLDYYIDLVWNKEARLGQASQFLIDHVRSQRLKKVQ
ncbi:LysR family transcriptional regulator [Acinetobacter sp. ME22]|uniref:HTH-type transcriptional regulator AceR n=2 Tax=Acinetobacter TaxID=469 RepID=UPI001EDADCD5|nr:LysR family transcriptional regulator [Acinetobacter sp. ME22]MCG2572307.1 LysR family transcriptional regulator [Acinetobacter sp. ME22]